MTTTLCKLARPLGPSILSLALTLLESSTQTAPSGPFPWPWFQLGIDPLGAAGSAKSASKKNATRLFNLWTHLFLCGVGKARYRRKGESRNVSSIGSFYRNPAEGVIGLTNNTRKLTKKVNTHGTDNSPSVESSHRLHSADNSLIPASPVVGRNAKDNCYRHDSSFYAHRCNASILLVRSLPNAQRRSEVVANSSLTI
ncbi:hypothetical protein DFH27DRAFT_605404 [Peziza echinospora]|nr:hypothetical protein DFH27DRAFT_605404 [Peziza echinospora]